MQDILEAITADAPADELAAIPIPESFRAAYVRRSDAAMFEGMEKLTPW